MRLPCYIGHIETRMARGKSGRIVIEVKQETKNRLYSSLALSGSTLKEWFSSVAEEYCASSRGPTLFGKETLISPPTLSVKPNYAERQTRYHVVSMFSGCGGMDLGFTGGFRIFGKRYPKLPFDMVWANDLNEAACRTYKRNLGGHVHCGDIWNLIDTMPKRADVLIGGFPCQDISINGKGRGVNGARSGLYRAMVHAIQRLKPRVFVAENVRALLMASRRDSLEQVIRDFSGLGYSLSVELYKAVDYGVPQIRERVFIVGVPTGRPAFVPPLPERSRATWMTSEEAIGDLIDQPEDAAINHVWSRANVSPEQGNRRISAHKPAHTIRAECHGNIQFHYQLARRLSMREAARIQTFPDDFIFDSKLRETERQVGNAVPPVLAWHIANAVAWNLSLDAKREGSHKKQLV
jgi:DNA (cytosine-5)-methyltransferase 1